MDHSPLPLYNEKKTPDQTVSLREPPIPAPVPGTSPPGAGDGPENQEDTHRAGYCPLF